MDPKKTEDVQNWPEPKSVKELQQFLGLANCFRKFMQGFSKLVAPLTEPLKKEVPWTWRATHQEAFDGVKYALTHAPVLALPDFDKRFTIQSDASGYCIGAVLMQDGQPIAYHSRKLKDFEYRYGGNMKELLAAYGALRVFRCYVQGVPFTLITDHKPNIGDLRTMGHMQAKWTTFLSEFYDCQFVYFPGKTNVADPLSRCPSFLCAIELRRTKRLLHAQAVSQDDVSGTFTSPHQGAEPADNSRTETDPDNIEVEPMFGGQETAELSELALTPLPPPPAIAPNLEKMLLEGYKADAWFCEPRNL